MRIATFNVQNLRLRGDRLDGARDADDPRDAGAAARRLDPLDRRLTAEIVALIDADVLALQEVFDKATLDRFHDDLLLPLGVAPYPHRLCLPGNDGRGLDLALLSRPPLRHVQSHAALTPRALGIPAESPDTPLFRRDALRVGFDAFSLWLVHLKAPYPNPLLSASIRQLEAEALRCLVKAAHGPGDLWLIAGDFNDPDPTGTATGLFDAAFAVDLTARLPPGKSWTYRDPVTGRLSAPDRFLASRALAARWPAARPVPVRFGLDRQANPAAEARLPLVGNHRPHASDHAALVLDLPGL
jgi:endonuclease/exonuclease/phosphatase family metal-dependent hydrolase